MTSTRSVSITAKRWPRGQNGRTFQDEKMPILINAESVNVTTLGSVNNGISTICIYTYILHICIHICIYIYM